MRTTFNQASFFFGYNQASYHKEVINNNNFNQEASKYVGPLYCIKKMWDLFIDIFLNFFFFFGKNSP